jgi:hypothetical protein
VTWAGAEVTWASAEMTWASAEVTWAGAEMTWARDPRHHPPVHRLPLLLLLALSAGPCQRAPVAAPEPAPAPERIQPAALAAFAAYPDPLASEAVEVSAVASPSGDHPVWARNFRSAADHSEPFTVFLCEGPCHIPLFEQVYSYRSLDVPLDAARRLAIGFRGFFLGGSIGFVRWRSPSGRFEVLVLIDMPPSDTPVSDAARAFYRGHDIADVLAAVGRGLDGALFAP